MKSTLSILILGFLLFSITFNSCRKKDLAIDLTTNSTQDNTVAENLFEDIRKVVVEVIDDEGASMRVKSGFSFGNCATININPAWVDTIWPKVITIDFGATNCIGTDGVKRRGKIIVTFSDLYKNPGSVLNVQLQNYYVNEHLIEGSKTITNNGRNSSNNLSFTVNVTNGKITFPNNGGVTTWSSVRTNEWIAGESTNLFTHGVAGICDDVYLITGNANGINRLGKSYTMQITNPLRKEICCRWLVSGTINITPSGLPTRILDFGTGACDNNASITIGSNTFNFMMF